MVFYVLHLQNNAGEMRQVDVAGHPVLLCRDQGHLKVNATFLSITMKTKTNAFNFDSMSQTIHHPAGMP